MSWLQDAKKRCEEATPGDWHEADSHETMTNIYSDGLYICQVKCPKFFDTKGMEKNTEFIAHARTDLPKALELLERAAWMIKIMVGDGMTDEDRERLKDWLQELEK